MKIQEICIPLFENYGQLNDVFYQAIKLSGDSYEHQSALELARELSIIRRSGTLVDVYETLVKKNLLFAATTQKDKDASYWVGYFSQMVRTRNEVATTFAIQEFSQLVFDSLTELKNRKEEKEGKEKYKVIHKAPNWILFKVEHKMAACRLGSGTKWCISARGDRNYFDNYKHDNDVFMVHTQNEKFAILVNKSTKRVFEVQYSENEYESPSPTIMQDFVKRLKEEGVDIEKVSKLIGTRLVENEIWVESFDLVEFGDAKHYGDWTITAYQAQYSLRDTMGKRWKTTLTGTLLGEAEDPKGETYYSWLNPDTSAGAKLWKVAAYNGEVKAPYDTEPLNRFIRMIKEGFDEAGIDPDAVSIGYSGFTTLNAELKKGDR